jgi:hypothetical protein
MGLAAILMLGTAMRRSAPMAPAPPSTPVVLPAAEALPVDTGDPLGAVAPYAASATPIDDESGSGPAASTEAPEATESGAPVVSTEPLRHLVVPYRTQFDGSTFAWGNCGVAAIAMVMEYYGHAWSTHELRLSINELTGNWDLEIGVDWRYLIAALAQRGFGVQGPYDGRGGYQRWTLDEVLAETASGRPVMLMAHYRSLPGHEDDPWIGDHYLLVLGETTTGQIIYHDPGFPGEDGAYVAIERERLERAWSNTWIGQNRTAMVILSPLDGE